MSSRHNCIGTSGLMTRDGVGKKHWLAAHASNPNFNCLEINQTFYAPLSFKAINAYVRYPETVSFCIKAPQFVTHTKRLKTDSHDALVAWWEGLRPLHLRTRALLFQLPGSFKFSPINLARVVSLLELDLNVLVCVEFREASWHVPEVYKTFRDHQSCMVGTLVYGTWLGNVPQGLWVPPRVNGGTLYIRVHGSAKYRGAVRDQDLCALRSKLDGVGVDNCIIMFNNGNPGRGVTRGPHSCPALKDAIKCSRVISNFL